MRKHFYGIFNIESSNFSLNVEEYIVYNADIRYTNSGAAYYYIWTTWFEYMKLRFRFWKMRLKGFSKVHIRRIK